MMENKYTSWQYFCRFFSFWRHTLATHSMAK